MTYRPTSPALTVAFIAGDVTFGQLAMFFSLIGFLNIVLLWPLVLCSYLLNLENLVWEHMPWGLLFGAGALSLSEYLCIVILLVN